MKMRGGGEVEFAPLEFMLQHVFVTHAPRLPTDRRTASCSTKKIAMLDREQCNIFKTCSRTVCGPWFLLAARPSHPVSSVEYRYFQYGNRGKSFWSA